MNNQKHEMRELTAAEKKKAHKLRELFAAYKDQHEPKLTKKKLAEELGWSAATVSFYINGKLALNYEAIYKFAKRLRFKPSEIDARLMVDPSSEKMSVQEVAALYDQLDESKQKIVLELLGALGSEPPAK